MKIIPYLQIMPVFLSLFFRARHHSLLWRKRWVFYLLAVFCCWLVWLLTNVSRLMLRCVSPAFFNAGNLRARVTPFVVIPIVWRKKFFKFQAHGGLSNSGFPSKLTSDQSRHFKCQNFGIEFDLKSRQSCQSFNDGHHLPSNQGLSSSQPDLKMNNHLKVS